MLKSMTIGQKIALVCGVLIALSVVLSVVSLVTLGRLNHATQAIVTDPLPSNYISGRLASEAEKILVWMNVHIQSESPEEMVNLESRIADRLRQWQEDRQDYSKLIADQSDRAAIEKVDSGFRRVMETWDKVLPLSRAKRNKEAYTLFHDVAVPAAEELDEGLKQMVSLNKTQGEQLGRGALHDFDVGTTLVWISLISTIACGIGLAIFVVRGVNTSLRGAATELAQGADQVANAATQVSTSSQQLAQGSSEQAASFEETSASAEEINSMARRNSEHSQTAAELVTHSGQLFEDANGALQEMVSAMNEIAGSSDKISRIIKVIDEIAFQTNILALNAAVEAARAGEAGMGFAVVADEVRNLAQRCAQAAKDTASLIEESIAKSSRGKNKVDEVAAAIATIAEETTKVKTLVSEVNLGSQEQTRGIEQVAKAVLQMEKVTQANAASAEESASAATELKAQSGALKTVVARLNSMVGGGASFSEDPQAPSFARLEAARPAKVDRSEFVLDDD